MAKSEDVHKIEDLPAQSPARRPELRELLYSALKAQSSAKITVGQIEEFVNGIVDIAVREAVEQCVQRIGCTCRQIDENTIKVNPACVVHGKPANR